MISFKAIHNLRPILNDVLAITCGAVGVLLHDPTVKFKCTLGDRSFTAASPKIWNGLADYIKKENDFDQFKRLIKTYYF